MKNTAIILFILLAFFSEKLSAQKAISGVKVEFATTQQNKDHDTGVEVYYRTADNRVIATARIEQGDNTEYPPNTSAILSLEMKGSYYDSDLPHSKINIRIFPNGHDTWTFDLNIIIVYSDGTESSFISSTGWSLSQDNSSYELTAN
jgi:hypothetical protein